LPGELELLGRCSLATTVKTVPAFFFKQLKALSSNVSITGKSWISAEENASSVCCKENLN